jgi:hypothetical protein
MAKSAPARATLCADAAMSLPTDSQSFARMWGMCSAIGNEFMVISGWLCSPMRAGASRQMVR